MIDRLKRSAPVAILVALFTVMIACGEQVSGSLGCPELCADETAALKDTTLTGAIVLDTNVFGYPSLGDTRDITLFGRGDTADVRLIIRFDTLPKTYVPTAAQPDSLIKRADSVSLNLYVDTGSVKATTPITVEAFDVDTTAADTAVSALLPLFRPARLLGSKTFQSGDFTDTLKLPLDGSKVYAKIRDSLRLRIGVRVSGATGTRLRVLSSQVNPRLRFRVSTDTLVKPDTVLPISGSPADDQYLQSALSVYALTASGALPTQASQRFVIGGLAGSRAFLKFNIPKSVLDSVQVIRASLLLNQLPGRGTARVRDTLTIFTHPVLSAPTVTDVRTAITFIGSPYTYGIDSVLFSARDSGAKAIELVNLLRFWKAVGDSNSTRAIVLRAKEEGASPGEIDFSSLESLVALRPRLRITYVPRHGFGLP